MPSPGPSALQETLGNVSIPLGNYPNMVILKDSQTVIRLAQGMHNGWPGLYPTTPSTCETAIEAAFDDYITGGWSSRCWLRALGKGIDLEIAAWVASWDTEAFIHTYAPSVGSIYGAIVAEIGTCGWGNSHTFPLPLAVATTWMTYFVQEGG